MLKVCLVLRETRDQVQRNLRYSLLLFNRVESIKREFIPVKITLVK